MDERAPIRILIVGDDPLARAGLATLLADQPGCTVAGQVDGASDVLSSIEASRPDVLIWDLGWNPEATLEHVSELRDFPLTLAVLLTDEASAPEALAVGARGLLPRNADGPTLAAAVAALSRGLTVIDPAFTTALAGPRERPAPAPVEHLTPRERSVLQLLAEGLPNKTIAERLNISEHTVKFHVNAIMGKLGAQSRTEAVTRAARLGLIIL